MLSDEMTTGSVTSTEAHKRALAARTHSWNIAQPRFREAFPEVGTHHCYQIYSLILLIQYSTPTKRDLPNMGEKERGKPDVASTSTPLQPSIPSRDVSMLGEEVTRAGTAPAAAPVPGWMTGWRYFIYEKWRLCAFIALAVMVSRFSSRG
jgi:ubiquitin-conjugating enzyme E2 J2